MKDVGLKKQSVKHIEKLKKELDNSKRVIRSSNKIKFSKYPKIYRLGHKETIDFLECGDHDIVVQEKIDGANFRFMIKDGKIIFGSRNMSLGDDKSDIGGNWKRCVEHVKNKLSKKDFNSYDGWVFYGECCVKHSIHYDFERMPPYLGYDIKTHNLSWIPYPKVKKEFENLGFEFVPVIKIVKAKTIKELTDKEVPKSFYYEGPAEGIVLKNYDNNVFTKYVTEKFLEVNKKNFGGGKKTAEDDSSKLVAIYCTNPRIDKQVFSLINEGEELHMKMMRYLPKRVVEDIYEENWYEILMSNWFIDLKKVRKKVADRCRAVLNQMITNNALQEVKNK